MAWKLKEELIRKRKLTTAPRSELPPGPHPSYLDIAQPVTLQSMLKAKQMAIGVAEVELVATRHRNGLGAGVCGGDVAYVAVEKVFRKYPRKT